MSDDGDDYPLYCTYGLAHDDFAGWFSVTNSKRCNDFCFWRQPNDDYAKDSYTSADPHQTTRTEEGARWGCIMDAVDNDITWSNAFDIYQDYDGEISEHLRCGRGPGEVLTSGGQDLFSSTSYWYTVMFLAIGIMIVEVFWFLRRRRRRRDQLLEADEGNNGEEMTESLPPETNQEQMDHQNGVSAETSSLDSMPLALNEISANDTLQDETDRSVKDKSHQIHEEIEQLPPPSTLSRMRNKMNEKCRCHPILINIGLPTLLVAFNLFLCFIIFQSIVALLELQRGVDLSHSLKALTPSCTATDVLCPDGNIAIDRPSVDRADVLQEGFEPFSYLIASDSQLNWYNGESAYMGKMNYPPPCSKRDSCGSCTRKFGAYTNMQMKHTIEKLIENSGNDGVSAGITGLVMNGDLTQYFHRHEALDYKSIYHNIKGLKQYFPSLGNHDYDQGSATYDGDEWFPPHYCNGKHAIAYFRSAFCNEIPKFDAKMRITRFDPKSLAYSWEEGFYHFIHLHFYPVYESAGLDLSSSLEWLERDLKLASEKNLTSVLFVHSVSGLPDIMKDVLRNSKVAIIFAGHLHRCLGRKCSYLRALNTNQAEHHTNGTGNFGEVGKCFPASAALCGRNPSGISLFYLSDMSDDLILPETKLFSEVPRQRGKCPVRRYATYINETDNTVLCTEQPVKNMYPFSESETDTNHTFIPIVWSGSSSFETLLKAEFLRDRIVVNVMTATAGNEGKRYVDAHSIPNAVYPFHNKTDMEEMIVFI